MALRLPGRAGVARSRVAVAATFAAHAVVAGTLGPWIPRLKADAGIDAAQLGLALSAFATGLVVGTRLAAPAVARMGRGAVRIGVPLLMAAFALLPFAEGMASLAVVFTAVGLASGLLDVAMNIEAAAVERRAGRRLMSGMHGTWSAAMLVGAGVASLAVAARVPIRVDFAAVAVVLAVGSFPLLRWLPPAGQVDELEQGSAAVPASGRSRQGRVVLLCLIPFAAFLTEGVAAEWSAVYLHEEVGAAAGIAGLGVVAFSAGMAASRFAGDRLATRSRPATVVRTGTSVAAAMLGAALVVGGTVPSLVAFLVVGLGLGPAVPLAFSAAATMGSVARRSVLGLAVTAGYLGSIAGPIAVGLTAAHSSLRWAFAIPVAMCVVAAVGATGLAAD